MFYKCSSLTSLDLSSFETKNVKSMQFMFNSCSSLGELKLTKFNTTNCETFTSMFTGIKSLNLTINEEDNEKLIAKINGVFEIINE